MMIMKVEGNSAARSSRVRASAKAVPYHQACRSASVH